MKNSNRVKSVLHIVLSMDVGGAEMLIRRIASAFSREQVRVAICCLDRAGDMAQAVIAEGIEVISFSRRPVSLDWQLLLKLRRLIASFNPDLIHTHNFEANFYGALAAKLEGRRPVVHTQHGAIIPFGWRQRLIMALSGYCTDRVVAVSNVIEDFARDYRWVPENKLVLIINGVQLIDTERRKLIRQKIRNQLAIPDDEPLIVNVARLAEIKNHQMLIAGFAEARKRIGRGYLVLVGDGDERNRIEKEVEQLCISGQVKLVGQSSDVESYLLASDVFALSSRYEGVSVALLEAMSAGLIPVVTRVGGNVRIVRDRENGYLVSSDNAMELADVLTEVLPNLDTLAHIKNRARETVAQHYSFNSMIDQYRTQYESVLIR